MKKILPFLFFSFLFLSVRAELNVEWIDDNTIIVSGYGNGGGVTNDNQLGSCTNCLAISPDEMRRIKAVIISELNSVVSNLDNIVEICDSINGRIDTITTDITGFRRFQDSPSTSNETYDDSDRAVFTNYVYGVENSQTLLDRSVRPSPLSNARSFGQWIGYNNGIYDYATSVVSSELSSIQNQIYGIYAESSTIQTKFNAIGFTVNGITEQSCQSCGTDGTNGTSCASCPCEEQWSTLLDYIRHIDEDQHKRYAQLTQISNNVFNIDNQFDSYARLVSGVLYNDATIVVDDGENSWSNVYRRGYSDLYDYDKSNILQRIELLLFGVTYNTSTNWGDVASSLESDKADIESTFFDIQQSVEDGYDSLDSDVRDLRDAIRDFFDALNFFGSGQLGDFALTDPFTVFDVYTFEVDSDGNVEDLRQLQTISRTAFQIVYWTAGVIFMIVFWFRFIGFVSRVVLSVIKYLNNLLT